MHELISLPYSYTDLEPYIDSQTVEIHHSKHHRSYVDKLNDFLKDTEFKDLELEELLKNLDKLPEALKTPIKNNAGQVYNHDLYWNSISPESDQNPTGELLDEIKATWGNLDVFKQEFMNLGASQFGSGWVWLSLDENLKLVLEKTANADNPLMSGKHPILTMDVWEHAYYLKYRNQRPVYMENFWRIIDWKSVLKRYRNLK